MFIWKAAWSHARTLARKFPNLVTTYLMGVVFILRSSYKTKYQRTEGNFLLYEGLLGFYFEIGPLEVSLPIGIAQCLCILPQPPQYTPICHPQQSPCMLPQPPPPPPIYPHMSPPNNHPVCCPSFKFNIAPPSRNFLNEGPSYNPFKEAYKPQC